MKKKLICIFLCMIFITTLCQSTLVNLVKSDSSEITGFRVGKVFGIFPSESEKKISFIMLLPPFGKVNIDKDRFSGNIGILFIYGKYQWFENGPPAVP